MTGRGKSYTRMLPILAALALVAFGPASVTWAGSFTVTPVRLQLTAREPSAVLAIINAGTAETVVQARLYRWTQPGGENTYTPTKALIVTPPIVRVGVGDQQLLRIGLRHPQALAQEQSYRIFVQEIPPPPEPGFAGLQVALRFSIPIFVAPAGKRRVALDWRLARADEHTLGITAQNSGNVHVEIGRLSLALASGKPLNDGKKAVQIYLLPGATRSWRIEIKSVLPPAGSEIRIQALSDQGPIEANVRLDS